MKFAQWLRTQNAGLGFFVLALVTQLNHAQDVAMGISKRKWLDGPTSWGFALSLESAVLFAVMNKRHKFSYAFALFSVAINVAYYESGMLQGQSMFHQSQFANHWSKWLASIILPFAIAFYSHTIAKSEIVEGASPLQSWWKSLRGRFSKETDLQIDEEILANDVFVVDPQVTDYKDIPPKYQDVFALLAKGPQTKAGIASETGISQSTLFRANGGKPSGILVEMEKEHLIANHTQGKQTVYSLNGANNV